MRYLTLLNGVICFAIAMRLLFPHYERGRPAWSIIVATGVLVIALLAVAALAVTQVDTAVINLSEVLINAEIAIAVYAVRGNVADLFHVVLGRWDGTERRHKGQPFDVGD